MEYPACRGSVHVEGAMSKSPLVAAAIAAVTLVVLAGCGTPPPTGAIGDELTFTMWGDDSDIAVTVVDIRLITAAEAAAEGWDALPTQTDQYVMHFDGPVSSVAPWQVALDDESIHQRELIPRTMHSNACTDVPDCVLFTVPAGADVVEVRLPGVERPNLRRAINQQDVWATWTIE